MKMFIQVLITLAMMISFNVLAEVVPEYQEEVKYLKAYITQSDCSFTRNDKTYKGSEAVTHIIRKEKYFKDEIKTAEDFIRLAATKSEMSGRKYTVKCSDAKTENLGDWFQHALQAYRNK